MQEVTKRRINSFSASFSALALGSLWDIFKDDGAKAGKLFLDNIEVQPDGATIRQINVDPAINEAKITGDGSFNLYYQLLQQGFDSTKPTKQIAQGIAATLHLENEKGDPITSLSLNEKLFVTLDVHPEASITKLAVVVTLPGGFEVDLSAQGLESRQSLPLKENTWTPTYIDVQEDRIVFFGDIASGTAIFKFMLKPLNIGIYSIPPIFAEDMYNPDVLFRGVGSSIQVTP